MTHPNFKRCEKCGEEIHVVDGQEVGHLLPCISIFPKEIPEHGPRSRCLIDCCHICEKLDLDCFY